YIKRSDGEIPLGMASIGRNECTVSPLRLRVSAVNLPPAAANSRWTWGASLGFATARRGDPMWSPSPATIARMSGAHAGRPYQPQCGAFPAGHGVHRSDSRSPVGPTPCGRPSPAAIARMQGAHAGPPLQTKIGAFPAGHGVHRSIRV